MATTAERAQTLLRTHADLLKGQDAMVTVLTYLTLPVPANNPMPFREQRRHAAVLTQLELLLTGNCEEPLRGQIIASCEGMMGVSMLTAYQRLRDQEVDDLPPPPTSPSRPKAGRHFKVVE